MPLVALATPSSSNATKATNNNCALARCEPAKTPTDPHTHNLGTTISRRELNITSILDVDEPVVAKGGSGGKGGGKIFGGGGGGGGHTSAAVSRSVSNPLSALRGPILVLTSLFSASRAQALWGEASEQAVGSEFVGKKML
jgi:hypothetical protein